MRIICDICSLPISGTVKKAPGNLNCHQDCVAQLAEVPEPAFTVVSGRSLESMGDTKDWKDPVLSASIK